MPTRIKNCGLKTTESVDKAVETGAGIIGFVHHLASPRHLSVPELASLTAYAKPLAKTVAVLMNPSPVTLDGVAAAAKPDYLQLHGITDVLELQAIQSRYGIPVIVAISVRSESDLSSIATLEDICAYLLFDAPSPGSGHAFDWRLLKNLPLKKKWFLAGGLTAENVAEALRATRAPMVDVSSGLEDPAGSGIKSLEKIAAFNHAVLSASN